MSKLLPVSTLGSPLREICTAGFTWGGVPERGAATNQKLHSYCIHQMSAVMDQGHVYLFFGKNKKRMKILVYDGSGLVMIAKRIERGSFMRRAELLERNEINLDELKLIFHGSIIRRPQVDRSMSASTAPSTQRESFALPAGLSHPAHR